MEKDEDTYPKIKSKKRAMSESKVTDSIAADCDNILVFLQAVALKAPRVAAVPLSLITDKLVRGLF